MPSEQPSKKPNQIDAPDVPMLPESVWEKTTWVAMVHTPKRQAA